MTLVISPDKGASFPVHTSFQAFALDFLNSPLKDDLEAFSLMVSPVPECALGSIDYQLTTGLESIKQGSPGLEQISAHVQFSHPHRPINVLIESTDSEVEFIGEVAECETSITVACDENMIAKYEQWQGPPWVPSLYC